MTNVKPIQALTMSADAVYLSSRPLPIAPTGYYDWQVSANPAEKRDGHSPITNLVNRAKAFKQKGGVKLDPSLIAAHADSVLHPQAVNDRKGEFPAVLGLMAKQDPYSTQAKSMNDTVIGALYNTVPHPPAAYVGPTAFRQADGGGNNFDNPDLGRSGTPSARSVQGRAGLPPTSLPDPGLVFDTLLKRKGIKNHAGGMSSLIFAYASIVTHSLFRTDYKNMNINNASSYLDLSPLYGDNQAAQDLVRDKTSGRGFMYPDTFSEERLTFLPPATSVLLVLFSRNHNYIADKLLKINERRSWSDPPPVDPTARAIQDEQIFQTAKLVNCGHFMNSIMGDYVASFLGLSENCHWNMDAFEVIKSKDLNVPRGLGNHCSVEFNVMYRWHATISEEDEKWTESVFREHFGNVPFDQLTLKDFATIGKSLASMAEPKKRTFFGLKRGPDGRFSDDDLAKILHTATYNPAGSFRGQGTPTVLRLVEIMGIEQARFWGVCTMNEFRQFLGLRQFETFEEWNPDPDIANAARSLYGHVDNLELYPGLQAETTMPITDGSRFACGYTMTKGILGDAIALVRGDRFFTSDFTPANLTAWGYLDCQRDMANGGFGGQIPKLLIRHLPRHYSYNSVYYLFPFFTPDHMKGSLTRLGLSDKYNFDPPSTVPIPKILNTFTGIKYAFSDPNRFKTIYEKYGYGSILMFDEIAKHDADKAIVIHALFPQKEALDVHVAWVSATAAQLLQDRSYKYPGVSGTYVDVVKDVINMVAVHVASEKLCGIDLKIKGNPSGLYTEREVFDMLTTLFTVTFLTFDDPENSFAIHSAAEEAGAIIGGLTAKSIMEIAPSLIPNFVGRLFGKLHSQISPPTSRPCYPFLGGMAASGRPLDQLVGNALGVAVGASINYSQAAVHVIDFYLDDSHEKERLHIIQLAQSNDAQSTELLRGYVREAMRLRPQFPGLWREALVDADIPQGPGLPPLHVKAGDRIWGSFRNAHLNPSEFPDPTSVDPRRPVSAYNLNGAGFHNCPGVDYAVYTITEITRSVFKLKNVRRAPGNAGKLARFTEIIHETETDFYVQRNGEVNSWPGSMHIVYDDSK